MIINSQYNKKTGNTVPAGTSGRVDHWREEKCPEDTPLPVQNSQTHMHANRHIHSKGWCKHTIKSVDKGTTKAH